ncbi:PAS domain S-box-containing protein [Caulobacter ginsengisoli]|uniref:histidine kinase n=1 Tax=Caulobacter ginsengisoli TaxID=400775 RepID=A0ABU0IVP0_9CAUL|nr:PAS domain-containing protein [Caulobacter ginsengisoli]MDQ0466092.1 PAS domain S-box-containing protein [Caulobacter ginsengisoli]
MTAPDDLSPDSGLDAFVWRLIPVRPPPFWQALAVTAAALAAAAGLRILATGWPPQFGSFSIFLPAYVLATLYAGPRWGWAAWLIGLMIGIFAPWYGALAPAHLGGGLLYAVASAATLVVTTALRAALIRLRTATVEQRHAEARLKLAEEAGGLGLWDWDLANGTAYWSGSVFHNLGFTDSGDPPSYAALLERVHPDDRERLQEVNRQAAADGRYYDIDYRVLTETGEIRWIHARSEVLRDAAGRAIRIVGYALNITDRRLAEEALRESEARFRALADSAPALLWVSRLDGRRDFANAAYVDFVGESYEAAVNLDWRTRLHPEDIDRVLREQVAGEASRAPFVLEARYRRADGEWRWLRSFSQPRHGPTGEFIGFAGIGFDVTSAKQVEADLQRLNELLSERVDAALAERDIAQAALLQSQKLEAVGQLTGGVAHDFNNLLTVIVGALDIIQRYPTDPVRIAKLSDAALSAAKRGERLTQQLLAFSRRQPLKPETLLIDALIAESEPLYRRAVGEAVELKLDLGASGFPVRLDAGQFEAALLNLLVNARDAMDGSGVITVETRLLTLDEPQSGLPAGGYLRVSVTDTGPGMNAETAARAFEPFFTTKAVGKGTGLGLSQVYGFARQSGGEVEIESVPGQGATIRMTLPLGRGEPAAPEASRSATTVRPMRVLLVEDDADVADLVENLLQELGHRVVRADTVAQALIQLRRKPLPDLLLTDVIMPGGRTGVDLAIEAVKKRPNLPIVLSSGYTGEALTAAEAAPWPLLRKPYSLEGLAQALAAAVEAAGRVGTSIDGAHTKA